MLEEFIKHARKTKYVTRIYPDDKPFTEENRLRIAAVLPHIYKFLQKVTRGTLPGCSPADEIHIAEAYQKFSSRSEAFLYDSCRLGLNMVSASDSDIIQA